MDRRAWQATVHGSVVSNSLRPHESQHARPPCPSTTPGVHCQRPAPRALNELSEMCRGDGQLRLATPLRTADQRGSPHAGIGDGAAKGGTSLPSRDSVCGRKCQCHKSRVFVLCLDREGGISSTALVIRTEDTLRPGRAAGPWGRAGISGPYLLWGSRASFHLRLLYPQAPSAPSFPTRCECMT